MVVSVAVETRQRAKRNKAMAEEEDKTPPPPPPPPPAAAVRRPRQPMPDHPPYCWMIGEAIDALGEDGGSSEDSISSFILAAHPGVPAAHDRFLRHYLAKHVAEGLFVCTALGRYARSTGEAAAGSSEAAGVEPPVVQVKRGRGRPRKDGSSSASPAAKKNSSAQSATPRRRGRLRRAAAAVAGDASVLTSSSVAAAVVDKDGSQVTASEPRRRLRLRKLATSTDLSGEPHVTDKEDDGIEAPSTTGIEHGRSLEMAVVVDGDDDGSATAQMVDNNFRGEAPPVDRDQRHKLALVTATDAPAPVPPMEQRDGCEAASFNPAPVCLALMAKQDGASATFSAPGRSSQSCKQVLVDADLGPVPLSVAEKEAGCKATSAKHKCLRPPRSKTLSATPKGKAKGHLRQSKLAGVATGAHSAPPSVTCKKAGNAVSSSTIKLTPATAGGGNGAPSAAPKPQGQPNRLYPLTVNEIPDDPSWCLLALPAATHCNSKT